MNIFFDEHIDLLRLFEKHRVEYLLVGGYAVILHGHRRPTGDLDLWLRPTNANKLKLIAALLEADFEAEDLNELALKNFESHLAFSLGTEPIKIDFLTRLDQVEFAEAFSRKILGEIDGLLLPVIHLNDLILSKLQTGRKKDEVDIEALQKIAASRKK